MFLRRGGYSENVGLFKMVLSKPDDAPVQKLFDLTGKVVAITGK